MPPAPRRTDDESPALPTHLLHYEFKFIKNHEELLDIDDEKERNARFYSLYLLEEGLKAADPRHSVLNAIDLRDGELTIKDIRVKLDKYEKIFIVGAGKAVGAMAEAIEEILKDEITDGVISVPKGTKERYRLSKIRIVEGEHPIPGEGSLYAADEILRLLKNVDEKTLVLVLLSGGGSALMEKPWEGIRLESLTECTKMLLASGASIDEVNVVRKHISTIKGGRLARAAYPAEVISLIISDVVGDKIDTIASGPTSPDPSTYEDAYNILKRYNIWTEIPEEIRNHIELGMKGERPETPKPGSKYFEKVNNIIVAGNRLSLRAMKEKAESLGLRALILSSMIEGEAAEVGKDVAAIAKELAMCELPIKRPAVIFMGGETTVTLKKYGTRGGRNQELVLSALLKLEGGEDIVIVAIGSDGIDGNSDAAGAIISKSTIKKIKESGINVRYYLDNHMSYDFFKKVGKSLIFTGPTGTNVNDFIMILAL